MNLNNAESLRGEAVPMPRRGLQHRVQIRSDLKETYQVRKHTKGSHLDPFLFLVCEGGDVYLVRNDLL